MYNKSGRMHSRIDKLLNSYMQQSSTICDLARVINHHAYIRVFIDVINMSSHTCTYLDSRHCLVVPAFRNLRFHGAAFGGRRSRRDGR